MSAMATDDKTMQVLRRSDFDALLSESPILEQYVRRFLEQAMLPEAYFKGGSIIGFSTLLGFLAAIWFKTLA